MRNPKHTPTGPNGSIKPQHPENNKSAPASTKRQPMLLDTIAGAYNALSFPYVWVYLLVMNVFLIIYSRKVRAAENTPEKRKINAEKKILFVIAHPDDESMFFVPTILGLVEMGYNLHLLCLSNGNAAGLGKIREKELEKAGTVLGFQHVETVDDPNLQDGMDKYWETGPILTHIERSLEKTQYHAIFSFDGKGVSGHLNHIAVYQAVCKLREQEKYKSIKMFKLDTVGCFRKFIGIFDSTVSIGADYIFTSYNPVKNWKAMVAHWSQLVWFRWLFLIFSRYVYVNSLTEMKYIEKTT